MAMKGVGLLDVAVLMATMFYSVHVHAEDDCMDAMMSLSPCLNYIITNSSVDDAATYPCCEKIMNVIHKQPPCLSSVVEDSGIPIDRTRVLALPAECKVSNHQFSPFSAEAVIHLLWERGEILSSIRDGSSTKTTFEEVVCDGILKQEYLSLCRDYIMKNEKNPSPECCRYFESLILKYPWCPLSYLSSFSPAGVVVVDRRHALSLPGACMLQFLSSNPNYLKVSEYYMINDGEL